MVTSPPSDYQLAGKYTNLNGLAFSVDHYPEEDEKLRASSVTRRRGGNCPNSLEVIQQLVDLTQSKSSLYLISVLPAADSVSTRFIKETLGPNVNFDSCIYRHDSVEPASAYVINSQRTGSRTIVSYNELPEMTLGEFSSSVDKLGHIEKTYFHFEVCLTCVHASSHVS